jgi:hypothetical protein
VDYSEGPCFGKQDLEEAYEWLVSEYDSEGEILYVALEAEMQDRDMICREELKEWEDYLSNNFGAEELEDVAVADTDFFTGTRYSVNT